MSKFKLIPILGILIPVLGSCVLVNRPIDLLGSGLYCQPVTYDFYVCRDSLDHKRTCKNVHGRWYCR